MSNFIINASRYVRGTEYYELDINPKDYLDFEEEELYNILWDDIVSSNPIKLDLDQSDQSDQSDWSDGPSIPNNFLEEWKKLKSEQ